MSLFNANDQRSTHVLSQAVLHCCRLAYDCRELRLTSSDPPRPAISHDRSLQRGLISQETRMSENISTQPINFSLSSPANKGSDRVSLTASCQHTHP